MHPADFLDRIPVVRRYTSSMFERHRLKQAALTLVADELDFNAGELANDRPAHEQFATIRFDAWHSTAPTLQMQFSRHHELLNELRGLYDDLQRMQRGLPGPIPERLREHARQLRNLSS